MNDETIRKVMQELGRRGGKSTSPAKAEAARANGAKSKGLEKARAKRWPKKGKKR